jgi:YXWGXW repeat-containing protein
MPITRTLAVAALCSAALPACVVAPAQPYPYGYSEPAGSVVVTDVAPPAPYYEPVPVAPYPGAIWIGGYWGWSGGRHTWIGGHYEHARPGYAWQPHRWEHRDGRWHLHEGHWARR